MSIIFIALGIITFFMILPFGLVKLTEMVRVDPEREYYSVGLKHLHFKLFNLTACSSHVATLGFVSFYLSNQFIGTFIFVLHVILTLKFNKLHRDAIKHYPHHLKVSLGFLGVGMLVGLFMLNVWSLILLIIYSGYWGYYHVVKAHGYMVVNEIV